MPLYDQQSQETFLPDKLCRLTAEGAVRRYGPAVHQIPVLWKENPQ
ncbi:MAG: hypothetical protein MZV70_13795 [Desulfobacterales bacterium]|nr:hypothetical protein [Desulfobacterales bacterium]